MRSPTVRLSLAALAFLAAASAAFYLYQLERSVSGRRAGMAKFDTTARSVMLSLEGARAGQLAYVAEGQGTAIWAPTVAAVLTETPAEIDALRSAAGDVDARSRLLEANARLRTFADVDRRALEYLEGGESLMASDLVFTEGTQAITAAIELVDTAWRLEVNSLAALESASRQTAAAIAGGIVGGLVLLLALLALPARARRATHDSDEARDPLRSFDLRLRELEPRAPHQSASRTEPRAVSREEAVRLEAAPQEVLLRETESAPAPHWAAALPDAAIPETGSSSATAEPSIAREGRFEAPPASQAAAAGDLPAHGLDVRPAFDRGAEALALLRSAADICVSMGAVRDADALRDLLARAAGLLEAPGLVVWLSDVDGQHLRASFAHGYAPTTLARMPIVERGAGNAVDVAWCSASLQVVPARDGGSGAVVAPLVTPAGCVGALSAEVAAGREHSEAVHALARLFAAQLSVLLGPEVQDAGAAPAMRAASA